MAHYYICDVCGAEMTERYPSGSDDQDYCSEKCYESAQDEHK